MTDWRRITIESGIECDLATFGEALDNMQFHFPFSPAEHDEFNRQAKTWTDARSDKLDELNLE